MVQHTDHRQQSKSRRNYINRLLPTRKKPVIEFADLFTVEQKQRNVEWYATVPHSR